MGGGVEGWGCNHATHGNRCSKLDFSEPLETENVSDVAYHLTQFSSASKTTQDDTTKRSKLDDGR